MKTCYQLTEGRNVRYFARLESVVNMLHQRWHLLEMPVVLTVTPCAPGLALEDVLLRPTPRRLPQSGLG